LRFLARLPNPDWDLSQELSRTRRSNRQGAAETALEAMLIAEYVRQLVATAGEWTGTYKQLLAELNTMNQAENKPKEWPKTTKKLSEDLKRLAPNLRAVGIECSISDSRHARSRTLTLGTMQGGENTSPTSPPSAVSTTHSGDVYPSPTETSPTKSPAQVVEKTHVGDVGDVLNPILSKGGTKEPDLTEEIIL
jgi:hypothetical protein